MRWWPSAWSRASTSRSIATVRVEQPASGTRRPPRSSPQPIASPSTSLPHFMALNSAGTDPKQAGRLHAQHASVEVPGRRDPGDKLRASRRRSIASRVARLTGKIAQDRRHRLPRDDRRLVDEGDRRHLHRSRSAARGARARREMGRRQPVAGRPWSPSRATSRSTRRSSRPDARPKIRPTRCTTTRRCKGSFRIREKHICRHDGRRRSRARRHAVQHRRRALRHVFRGVLRAPRRVLAQQLRPRAEPWLREPRSARRKAPLFWTDPPVPQGGTASSRAKTRPGTRVVVHE